MVHRIWDLEPVIERIKRNLDFLRRIILTNYRNALDDRVERGQALLTIVV